MAKDWITGRSWARGSSSSPFAMAALGFLQAMQQNQRRDEVEKQRQEMIDERKALEQVKTGRELLEKMAQLDPTLWAHQDFTKWWMTGDTLAYAQSGLKPNITPKAEEVDYEKQVRQSAYRKQASGEPLSEDERILIGLSNKQPTMADLVKLGEGDMIANPRTKETVIKNQRTAKPAVGGGGSGGSGGGGAVVRPKGADWIQKNADVHPITGQPFPDGKTHVIFVNRLNPTEVKIGPAILIGSATPGGDPLEELLKDKPKEPGTLSKLWGAAKSLFADDDEEDIAKIRSALQ
jgi:hypothetical protein